MDDFDTSGDVTMSPCDVSNKPTNDIHQESRYMSDFNVANGDNSNENSPSIIASAHLKSIPKSSQLLSIYNKKDLVDEVSVVSSRRKKSSEMSEQYESMLRQSSECGHLFRTWSDGLQIDFIQRALSSMTIEQHSSIQAYLGPMLQRDFISLLPVRGLNHVAVLILTYLDAKTLRAAEVVCKSWLCVISENMIWKRYVECKVATDSLWRGLAEKRGWIKYLFKGCSLSDEEMPDHSFYRRLYPSIVKDISQMEENWLYGRHNLQRINCRSENSKGVYCLQYDDKKIVSGLRDNTIKIWSRSTLECTMVLNGHLGSVLCLQYDDRIIVSGSSDSSVRVWDVETGEMVNSLTQQHTEAVLHLRFYNGTMVTCSKDRSICVWSMVCPTDITIRQVLVGHRAAVNVVDFDDKYIVSASGDRTIKVWDTTSCEFKRTLSGHKRGIACLQYHQQLVVSGSSDNSIRLWNIETGYCLRVLEGHEELVRCIRFDSRRIVSGAYDGKIKVWDLIAALDPLSPPWSLCIRTLCEHTGRVFRLQFDEFEIVSSSHDDTILIWDFLRYDPSSNPSPPSSSHAQSQAQSNVNEEGSSNLFVENNDRQRPPPLLPPPSRQIDLEDNNNIESGEMRHSYANPNPNPPSQSHNMMMMSSSSSSVDQQSLRNRGNSSFIHSQGNVSNNGMSVRGNLENNGAMGGMRRRRMGGGAVESSSPLLDLNQPQPLPLSVSVDGIIGGGGGGPSTTSSSFVALDLSIVTSSAAAAGGGSSSILAATANPNSQSSTSTNPPNPNVHYSNNHHSMSLSVGGDGAWNSAIVQPPPPSHHPSIQSTVENMNPSVADLQNHSNFTQGETNGCISRSTSAVQLPQDSTSQTCSVLDGAFIIPPPSCSGDHSTSNTPPNSHTDHQQQNNCASTSPPFYTNVNNPNPNPNQHN